MLQLLHTALRSEHKRLGFKGRIFPLFFFILGTICLLSALREIAELFLSLSLAAQVEDMSIKLQFNTYEKWTKALK